MLNEYVLFIFGFIGLVLASKSDLKEGKIPNSINFNFLFVVLIFRIVISFSFFLQGFCGALIFFLVATLFFRGEIFGLAKEILEKTQNGKQTQVTRKR